MNKTSSSIKPFSERILNGSLKLDVSDVHGVANQMIFEINLLAGKMLILQHKLIEVIKISPRHIVENLHVEYKDKIRERWNASILRNVIPTRDFALPSEENVGDTHKKMAKTKRATDHGFEGQMIEALGGGSSGLGNFDSDALKVEDLSIFGQTQIHPIIFEECYVKDSDPKFVQLVRANPDLLTEESLLSISGTKQ